MKKSAWFIIIMIAAIAIFDVYVIATGGTEASISHTIILWSYDYPAFSFLSGFTAGHLFWRMRSTKETKEKEAIDGKKD
jgi:hypothetical protein